MARRDEVLEAAIDLLDEVGLDAFTTRRLAGRLEVRASALYRHYPSKQALLDAMVAHMVGDTGLAALPEGPWDDILRAVAIGTREGMLAHRDGARLIATFNDPGEVAVESFTNLIARLTAQGVPDDTAVAAVDTMFGYVNGFTMEEQAREISGPAGAHLSREQRDKGFRAGLELIIDGIRTRVRQPDSADRPTRRRR
ncbi:MAG TPA: TetR/AcrR family transcriptional regulator C-terminal domain-containing protein [Streptosporangiaceae bacterium]|jgi:TetR/AcrR family tetracycline transcriptional repressor